MGNLLPLDTFRAEFGYSPWHFWGLASTANFPVSDSCSDLVYQYAWQANDSAGRDDIRQAIESAENMLREHLRYSIAPHFVTETINPERWHDAKLNRTMYADASGRWLNVQLREGKIQQIGVETRALIGTVTTAGGSLVTTDADGDSVIDTFTATIATTVTDVSQIEIMFAVGDRWTGEPAGDKWVIKPVTVTIAGGVATIRGRIWQIVKPVLYESGQPLAPATAANYATSLEVYRHYCDPTGTTQDTAQAVLIWETQPWPYFCSVLTPTITNSGDPAALGYALARVTLRDAERGIVGFGEAAYNTTSGAWESTASYRPPDRILIRYLAGDALDSLGHMQERWAKVVARFAAAELGKRICACESASRMIYEQQVDRAFGGDARVEKFNMTEADNASPFGYKEGQLQAWRIVRNLRQFVGVIG